MRTLKNKDQAIHNYLISLYAEYEPEKLLRYLKVQGQVSQVFFKIWRWVDNFQSLYTYSAKIEQFFYMWIVHGAF